MLAEFNHHWQWMIIKIVAKHSIKNNKNRYIINQEIIQQVKSNPKMVKKLIKKINTAEIHLKIAVNQFNEVLGEQEIKDSIYKIIKCEKEISDAIDFAEQEFEQLLSK